MTTALLVTCLTLVAGCGGAQPSVHPASVGRTSGRSDAAARRSQRVGGSRRPTRSRAPVASAGGLRLVQLPAAGFGPIESQIVHARRSIDMEMYELADPGIESDLIAAARRGVDVRVLLDRDYDGGLVNGPAYADLRRHAVAVRWAPSRFIFHIKATTFDGATADISTGNLVGEYAATSRDATIVDTEPGQVRAIAATFDDDWNAGPGGDPAHATVQARGLVWSPDTGAQSAQSVLVAQVVRARGAVDVESEELSDPAIIDALAAAARRGVDCRIVMTASAQWDGAFARVSAAGCHVHVLLDSSTGLYIHEKLILDDAGTAHASMFLGSQNASVSSLTRNRELGIIVGAADGGAAVMRSAAATFARDFADAPAWRATTTHRSHAPGGSPAPMTGACHPLSEEGHCDEPGEYCSDADHGMSGFAGDGETISCRDDDGWRWVATG